MSDEDRQAREPEDGKVTLVRDDDGGVRLVPGGNIVEGDVEEDGGQDSPTDTSPSP